MCWGQRRAANVGCAVLVSGQRDRCEVEEKIYRAGCGRASSLHNEVDIDELDR